MLTQWASWRWVLFVNVPIGIAVLLVARRFLPETARNPGRFDLLGALTSTLGMTALVYGFVRAASTGWGDPVTVVAFAVGVVLLAAFVAGRDAGRSRRSRRCGCSPTATGAPPTSPGCCWWPGMFGMFFFLTQFLQEVLGYSPLVTGLAFLPLTIALFAASQAQRRRAVERFAGQAADGRRARLLHRRAALAEPAVGDQQLPVAARAAGAVRPRQRPGVRAADRDVAGAASRPATPARRPGWST